MDKDSFRYAMPCHAMSCHVCLTTGETHENANQEEEDANSTSSSSSSSGSGSGSGDERGDDNDSVVMMIRHRQHQQKQQQYYQQQRQRQRHETPQARGVLRLRDPQGARPPPRKATTRESSPRQPSPATVVAAAAALRSYQPRRPLVDLVWENLSSRHRAFVDPWSVRDESGEGGKGKVEEGPWSRKGSGRGCGSGDCGGPSPEVKSCGIYIYIFSYFFWEGGWGGGLLFRLLCFD